MMRSLYGFLVAAFLVGVAQISLIEDCSASTVYYEPEQDIATMQAITNPGTVLHAIVYNYYSTGGRIGGGGNFDYTTANLTDGGCNDFPSNTGVGTWVRQVRTGPYDVRNCGATPDGSTDNTSMFQAAIDYLNSVGGGVAVFSAGSSYYNFTNAIIVKSGVTLRGLGNPSLHFTGQTSMPYIQLIGSNIGVQDTDIYWQGGMTAAIGNTPSTGSSVAVSNIDISGLHLDLTGATGYTAIAFGQDAAAGPAVLNDLHIHGNFINNVNYGVLLGSSLTGSNAEIIGNTIINTHGDPIAINTAAGFINTTISGNVLGSGPPTAGGGFGISFRTGGFATVTGNILQSCTRECIHIENLTHDISIVGNTFNQTTLDHDCFKFTDTTGLYVSRVVISGNTCNAPTGSTALALELGEPQTEITFTDNRLSNWGSGATSTSPAYAMKPSAGETIANNVFTGGNQYAIAIHMIASASSVIQPATPLIHDNQFDSYGTIYETGEGGEFGKTILTGTLPTSLGNSINSGPLTIDSITSSGTQSVSSGANTITVMPAPVKFLGQFDILAFNKSTPATHVNASTYHIYDGTTDIIPQSANAGNPTFHYSSNSSLTGLTTTFTSTNTQFTFTSPSSISNLEWVATLSGKIVVN